MRTESDYLIISNKDKITNSLTNPNLDQNDIIDILISLHIVLEVGLNTFFRHLSLIGIKKKINEFEIMSNLDKVNFRDKVTLFIYNSKFNFKGKEDDAVRYHKIIGKLRNFSGMRNRLLHGHSISTIFDGKESRNSQLKQKITLRNLKIQIKEFVFILKGMSFYLDCLESSLTISGKKDLQKEYLSDDFLLNLR